MRCQAEAGRLQIWPSIFLGAAAQGDKANALLVEAVQMSIGGQLGIEDEFGRRLTAVLVPELDEALHLVGSIGPGDTRIGVA